MPRIFVDADGCPVKQEVYRVAERYGLQVTLVANSWMRTPNSGLIELVLVNDQLDAADDWIAGHAAGNDIVITGDIPLASRCLKVGAKVIGPRGDVFNEESIGDVLGNRDLMSHLRDLGAVTGGPEPMRKKDRSRFLQRLDETIQAIRRLT